MRDESVDGTPCVDTEPAGWVDAQEVVESLNSELCDWALTREKVLEKLDLRAARRARQLSFELRSLASQPADFTESEEELSDLLDACHALLDQRSERMELESTPPPDSGIVECPRLPSSMLGAGLPVLHDDASDPEETAPGSRRAALARASQSGQHRHDTVPRAAALVSLAFDDDDDSEATRAGVPERVMESYLDGIRNAAGRIA